MIEKCHIPFGLVSDKADTASGSGGVCFRGGNEEKRGDERRSRDGDRKVETESTSNRESSNRYEARGCECVNVCMTNKEFLMWGYWKAKREDGCNSMSM